MKLLKNLYFLSLFLFSTHSMAFPCFITLIKGNCWKAYTVTVDVLDAETNQVLLNIVIPKDSLWGRARFESKPKQRLIFKATFEPAFWKQEEGVQYAAKHSWSLPETVEGETLAWNVNVCFPLDFSSVPMPPDAGSDCRCDKKSIPAIDQNAI